MEITVRNIYSDPFSDKGVSDSVLFKFLIPNSMIYEIFKADANSVLSFELTAAKL